MLDCVPHNLRQGKAIVPDPPHSKLHLLVINMGLAGDLPTDHDHTSLGHCLAGNLRVGVLPLGVDKIDNLKRIQLQKSS